MTNEEIKLKIEFNNKRIASLVDPTQFVLNREVSKLINENKKLQEKCTHTKLFEGVCVYCGKVIE